MKENELRIGNLVYIGKEVNELELVDFADLYENDTFKHFEPIPLTEEWLVNFGFEYLYFNSEELIHKEFKNLYAYKHVMKDGFGIVLRGFHTLPFVKHVHQLQNLYFALTGEELTLSE